MSIWVVARSRRKRKPVEGRYIDRSRRVGANHTQRFLDRRLRSRSALTVSFG